MTVPPPPGQPGQYGAWNAPAAGGSWPPPGGAGGYPEQPGGGWGQQQPAGGGYPEQPGGAWGQQQPTGGGYPEQPGGTWPPPAGVGGYPDTAVYPGGGYPPPGYPPTGYPPQKPGTNGFAIAALIFGIIGGALLGFIFGFVALSQTKRTGQNGRGMAIAGIILSAMWTILVVILVVVAVSTATTVRRDPGGIIPTGAVPTGSALPTGTGQSGGITQGGDIAATALQVGDCVNDLKDSTNVLTLPGVPCAQAHEGEVYAVFDLPVGDYPGADAVDRQVSQQCNARLSSYSPGAVTDPAVGLFSVYPLEQNWVRGDRQVVCIATATSGTTTGSIRGK